MPNATRKLHARIFSLTSPCQPQSVPAHYCHWEEGIEENWRGIPHTLSLRARQGVAIQSEALWGILGRCGGCPPLPLDCRVAALLAMTRRKSAQRPVFGRKSSSCPERSDRSCWACRNRVAFLRSRMIRRSRLRRKRRASSQVWENHSASNGSRPPSWMSERELRSPCRSRSR